MTVAILYGLRHSLLCIHIIYGAEFLAGVLTEPTHIVLALMIFNLRQAMVLLIKKHTLHVNNLVSSCTYHVWRIDWGGISHFHMSFEK